MRGIQVRSLHVEDTKQRRALGSRNYDLGDIVRILGSDIEGLYWVLDDVIPMHDAADGTTFDDYQLRNDELFVWTRDNVSLAVQDFVPRYAKFLYGDWDHIVGVRKPPTPDDVSQWGTAVVPGEAVVVFQCVDAAFWEVYSTDEGLLERLAQRCTRFETVFSDSDPPPARPN